MIVALIALFIALSGTAYAVANLPKRSVGSLQLKRGAVHKENIAAGAVTAAKLAKALPVSFKAGWADRAGKADRATHADRARAATSADSASVAAGAATAAIAADATKLGGQDPSFFLPRSTIVDLPRFELADGGERSIALGPFTYLARCRIDSAGSDMADIVIRSSRNNSAFDGDQITANLLSSAPASARRYLRLEGPTGEPRFFSQNDGTAVAPGGGEVRSTVWYAGLNLFDTTGRCYFGGFAIV